MRAETLTDQEIEDYLDAAGELSYLPIFLLTLEQGLRQRELIALKWSDLDVKTRTLTIHEGRVVECGKLVEHQPNPSLIARGSYHANACHPALKRPADPVVLPLAGCPEQEHPSAEAAGVFLK